MKKNKKSQKRIPQKRIRSEQGAVVRVTNKNLVCKDCLLRLDDNGPLYGNTSRCEAYPSCKPLEVLGGGECEEYVKE